VRSSGLGLLGQLTCLLLRAAGVRVVGIDIDPAISFDSLKPTQPIEPVSPLEPIQRLLINKRNPNAGVMAGRRISS